MTIELPANVEEQLRGLAVSQGRDVSALVADAVRQYLEAVAITDLEDVAISEAQRAMLVELGDLPDWRHGER